MRFIWRWLKRGLLAVVIAVIAVLAPVGYIETMCRGAVQPNDYTAVLPADPQRVEGRTLLTYPEWHIVHAYDDYAEVIRTGDPHEFGFLSSIGGFWGSLCALSEASGDHGGFPWATKQMVYTIGVSFTAELLLKAAYEESLGRIATLIRGDTRAALDDVSARQASDYATFLQQVPWYKWDFPRDAAELGTAAQGGFRDWERGAALGIEYGVKASYAGVIAAAVAGVGPDNLTMRVIVAGVSAEQLGGLQGVKFIATRPEGIELETVRYRAFTDLAKVLAGMGAEFVEIAGNDDILFTAISDQPTAPGALHSFARQGNAGYRHLMLVKVPALAAALRADPAGVEHIHDY